jgi:ketosteroid isomerase-like protein
MSQENVEIVRGLYAAISRGDTRIILDTYDPEVTWDFTLSPFASVFKRTVYHGHDGLHDFVKERFEEAWDEITDELEELIDAGEQVISVVRSGGRGRMSGAKVSRTHAGVWTLHDRKVVQVQWFATRDDALDAAGLRE